MRNVRHTNRQAIYDSFDSRGISWNGKKASSVRNMPAFILWITALITIGATFLPWISLNSVFRVVLGENRFEEIIGTMNVIGLFRANQKLLGIMDSTAGAILGHIEAASDLLKVVHRLSGSLRTVGIAVIAVGVGNLMYLITYFTHRYRAIQLTGFFAAFLDLAGRSVVKLTCSIENNSLLSVIQELDLKGLEVESVHLIKTDMGAWVTLVAALVTALMVLLMRNGTRER